ncbi:MAG: branched-chain amino acid ABC transporter substrate-binding protein, partial [Anaerolineaceae bacterium]|nr:branched-chain amino acid ABC transporter substrate-binding protein [Anaerolineaceae bacterium]
GTAGILLGGFVVVIIGIFLVNLISDGFGARRTEVPIGSLESEVQEQPKPLAETEAEEELPVEICAPEEDLQGDEWGYLVFPDGTLIKIGVSVPFTDSYGAYGRDIFNGVEMAVDEIEDVRGWRLAVESEDDKCDWDVGVVVAEQFTSDPNVLGVIGPMCSDAVIPASTVYDENHMVMISPSSSVSEVTARGYKSIFRVMPNDGQQVLAAVEFISQDLGVRSLAIAHDQSVYGEGIARAVREKFEAFGGTVTSYEGIADFSDLIAVLLKADPGAIYWGGLDADGAGLVNQLRASGFEGVFMAPDGTKTEYYIEAAGGAAEGSYFTVTSLVNATGYKEFEAAFTEKYGSPVAYSSGSYDAARILLQAAEIVAYVDDDGNLVIGRKALADQVRATSFEGVSGHIEFTETGDLGSVSIIIYQVVDDDFVEVKTVNFND